MTGTVISTGFTGTYAHLNGNVPMTASRTDLIRSLLTVGYRSRKAAAHAVGPWRERMLVAMATGFLTQVLRTRQFYRNLEQTEKRGYSFLFGEAFTHWYAQNFMQIPYLLHVDGLTSCVWGSSKTPAVMKAGAGQGSPKSRPDFIGIDNMSSHVFESKGCSRAPQNATKKKALAQVSMLHHVNGVSPVTRCATFFMLKAKQTDGLIIDPPSSQLGVNVAFDRLEAIKAYYSFFFERELFDLPDERHEGFIGREVEESVDFCIDRKVVHLLKQEPRDYDGRQALVEEIFTTLKNRQILYDERRVRSTSIGIDGLMVVDRSLPVRRPRVMR